MQDAASSDPSPMVRVAMTFALTMFGQNYLSRLIDAFASDKTALQAQGYLLELGPKALPGADRRAEGPQLRRPRGAAGVIGALGSAGQHRGARPPHQGSRSHRRRERHRGDRTDQAALSRASRMTLPVTLPRSFYARPTLDVARDLIGKVLVHDTRTGLTSGVIVEVEAYIGESDPACHAAPGPTARNAPLYGPPGIAYVYLNYGIHYLVNAVTEEEGSPAAVLIRALEPLDGEALMRARRTRGTGRAPAALSHDEICRGPGNLTRALGITLRDNRLDLTNGPLRIEDRGLPPREVEWTPRIGITVGVEPRGAARRSAAPRCRGGSHRVQRRAERRPG